MRYLFLGILYTAAYLGAGALLGLATVMWLVRLERDCVFVTSARNGDGKTVKAYLDQGVPPDGPRWQASTACEVAAASGQIAVVELLLAHGADPNKGIYQAIRFDHSDIVRVFLAHGAKARRRDAKSNASPLDVAIRHGNSEIVEILTQAQ